jgi:hypothetical protein
MCRPRAVEPRSPRRPRSLKPSIRIRGCLARPTTPASGFFLRHLRNLEMSHVEIANAAPDARPAFYLAEVERADFFAITAPKGAFALHQVKDLRIGWSRATTDITLTSVDNKTL